MTKIKKKKASSPPCNFGISFIGTMAGIVKS